MLTMKKRLVEKMLEEMRERANKVWPAMYQTYPYKQIMSVLAKKDEDITFSDKEMVRNNLELLCDCLSINYYNLLGRVCQKQGRLFCLRAWVKCAFDDTQISLMKGFCYARPRPRRALFPFYHSSANLSREK